MIKNWQTSLGGIVSILIALYHCYSMGKIDIMCVYAVIVGTSLLRAKDQNVTGGTVPATVEAEARVTSPKI